jgi:predicted nucleotidyltransferase
MDLGLPEDSIHLRGSILYAHPRPDSDLDLSIVGKENFAAYIDLIEQARGVKVMPPSEVERNVDLLSGVCPLPKNELVVHVRRRKTKLHFDDVPVSVKCVRSDADVKKEIPDFSLVRASNLGESIIQGTVLEASASCCYPVEFEVEAISPEGHQVSSILCFESLFAEFLLPGESFEAKGIIQKIKIGNNACHYRLILGTRELVGKEYLRGTDLR